MKLSVIIPAFNEERTIAGVLDRLLALKLPQLEVLVVDDGSADRTGDVAAEYAARHPEVIRLLRQGKNQGKTAAVARGLAEFTGDIVMIQDADTEYDPAEIPDLIAPILEGRADVVYGSRFLVKRAARVLYYYHYLANKCLTGLSNMLTNRNMSDIETCYKAMRSEVARPLRLRSRGFGLEVELTAAICQTRARTYEVPISYHGRTYEEGKKIGWRDGVAAVWYLLYFNLVHRFSAQARRYRQAVDEALEKDPSSGRRAKPIAAVDGKEVDGGDASEVNQPYEWQPRVR